MKEKNIGSSAEENSTGKSSAGETNRKKKAGRGAAQEASPREGLWKDPGGADRPDPGTQPLQRRVPVGGAE